MSKLKSGNISEFKDFSKFKSLREFNNHIEQWMVYHKSDFTKSELIALKRLIRFSAKCFGVANAKIGTVLRAINEEFNGFGISRSSLERMLRKAININLLSIVHTVKPTKGGKGHNVYVFNRIDVLKEENLTYSENGENPTGSKTEQGNSGDESIIPLETGFTGNTNHLNVKRSSYIKYVPKSLQHFQALFGKQVKDIYSRVCLAFKTMKVSDNKDLRQEIGLVVMNQLKQYIKDGKEFTADELLKYSYKIGVRQLEQRLAVDKSPADNSVDNKDVQAIGSDTSNRKSTRTEMIPHWLHNQNPVETKKKESSISDEQKKAIWEQVNKLRGVNNS
ncbi:hypothetical protein [Peribacillus asahii]|uniref:hypothetical protein n=1 Tax=Peribacillus asahii TaxID=228899 RepID=UPI00382A4A7B